MARKPAPPSPPTPRYADPEGTADYIGVHPRTIRKMRRDGRLTAYTLGPRVVRYDLNEVDAALGREVGA